MRRATANRVGPSPRSCACTSAAGRAARGWGRGAGRSSAAMPGSWRTSAWPFATTGSVSSPSRYSRPPVSSWLRAASSASCESRLLRGGASMDGKRADAGISASRPAAPSRLPPAGLPLARRGERPTFTGVGPTGTHTGALRAQLWEVGMGEVRFAPGEVVFREGEPSRAVLFVREGEVEVAKAAGTGEVVLGTVGPGEFAGEMGVVEGRPRSATVRARGEVLGEMVERRAFLERVSRDPRLAFGVLLRLSERLHAADERLADAAAHAPDGTHVTVPAGAAPAAVGERLVLLAASEALAGQVPAEGVAVDRLPFEVGRRPAADEHRRGGSVHLELEDGAPYRLSRRHFAVVASGGGLAVRDDHSTLGTVVNGEAVGEQFPRSEAPLRRGENLVVAGGTDSPFAFRLVVG